MATQFTTPDALPYPQLADLADIPLRLKDLADRMQALRTADNAASTTYTPVLTATTNPSLGTSPTVEARYKVTGKMVRCWGRIWAGSGASPGSGTWALSLPSGPGLPTSRVSGSLLISPNWTGVGSSVGAVVAGAGVSTLSLLAPSAAGGVLASVAGASTIAGTAMTQFGLDWTITYEV